MSETQPTPDAAVAVALCSLCQTPLAEGATAINGNPVCEGCATQVQAELQAEQATGARLPLAFAGGALGAVLGAAIWAGIVITTNFAIGYVAVLVGYLAGLGVKLGAGAGRSQTLQALAAGLAFAGLVISKYFIFAHYITTGMAEDGSSVGYFDPQVIALFPQLMGQLLSPFDLLWVAFALSAAWRVPAPSRVALGG